MLKLPGVNHRVAVRLGLVLSGKAGLDYIDSMEMCAAYDQCQSLDKPCSGSSAGLLKGSDHFKMTELTDNKGKPSNKYCFQ